MEFHEQGFIQRPVGEFARLDGLFGARDALAQQRG